MERKWWKECVVYQIYPRSFYDTNQDGIGDLEGIIRKLEYLKELGIGAIWLNPIYESPNDDMGYDISNYQGIMKEFGTMEDFDRLLTKAHQLGIRIIMDLVVNHSSDEHKWFIESKSSKNSDYRDYYIWRKGKDGKEPNNWASFFTPSAWKYDAASDEYYLHLFSEKQPDLNWENEKVRNEIYTMINWWLDKGVDGFRMDVINLIGKNTELPDGTGEKTVSGYVFSPEYFANQENMFQYLKELRVNCFDGRDGMCVGETPFVTPETGKRFFQKKDPILDMIFQFELMDIDSGASGKWEIIPYDMDKFKKIIAQWQEATTEGWGSLFWSNHDQPRPISRFVKWKTEEERIKAAKMLGAAMHLLKGTSFLYQGEEIGMTNVKFQDLNDLKDIESIVFYDEMKKNNKKEQAWDAILKKGRDNARTPMQWNSGINGGFSEADPWIKVNENFSYINVEKALEDENSILYFYKELIKFKSTNEVAVYGDFKLIETTADSIFAYSRSLQDRSYEVYCNFSSEEVPFVQNREIYSRQILKNYEVSNEESMKPFEVRVLLKE